VVNTQAVVGGEATASTVPHDVVAITRDLAERAKKDVERVQERLRSAQAIERFCSALHTELDAEHPSEALRLIRAGANATRLLRDRSPQCAAAVESIADQLAPQVEKAFNALLRSFPSAAQEVALKLDPSSRHPNYTLCDGFLTIKFEKRRLEARIQPRDGRRTTLGVDIPVVIDHLRAEVDRLFGREFDAKAVRGAIEKAYGSVVTAGKQQPGDAIPLKNLISEMAKDKRFRADEFNVDLSRVVRSDKAEWSQLQLDHSRDPKNGLLLWQLDQRGYYGYIRIGGDTEPS
jgi:hypothetical protein